MQFHGFNESVGHFCRHLRRVIETLDHELPFHFAGYLFFGFVLRIFQFCKVGFKSLDVCCDNLSMMTVFVLREHPFFEIDIQATEKRLLACQLLPQSLDLLLSIVLLELRLLHR